jgi:hypothetical protein
MGKEYCEGHPSPNFIGGLNDSGKSILNSKRSTATLSLGGIGSVVSNSTLEINNISFVLDYRGPRALCPCDSLLNPNVISLRMSWNTSLFPSTCRPSGGLDGVSDPLFVGDAKAANILSAALLVPPLFTMEFKATLLPPGLPVI